MKTVVISGGTKGLGRELSLIFGKAGYYVIALYHSDKDSAQRLDAELREHSLLGKTLLCNITDLENVEQLTQMNEIMTASELTVIHNAASPFTPKPMHLLTWDEFQKDSDVSLKGAWNLYHHLIRPLVKAKQGNFIAVLSTALKSPMPKGFASYIAAKSSLEGFVKSLEVEHGKKGLRTLSVYPKFMKTALTSDWPEAYQNQESDDPKVVAQEILTWVQQS